MERNIVELKEAPKTTQASGLQEELSEQFVPHARGGAGHGGGGGGGHSGGGGFPRPGGGGHGGGDRPHPIPHPNPHPIPGPRPGPGPDHGHPHPGPGPRPGPGPDHGHHPPNHGFPSGRDHWGPPEHGHWGWHDEARWGRGWDTWFFRQDPNFNTWNNPIRNEAANIAAQMDRGNGAAAALELSEDLYAMRGDLYAQDELLSEVNAFDRKGLGADIGLGQWNPARGTWDNVQIFQPGLGAFPISTFNDYDDRFPIATGQTIAPIAIGKMLAPIEEPKKP